MPGFQETLELVLHTDTSGAISQVKNWAGETESSVSKVESSFKKVSAAALKLGAAGLGIGGFLTAMADDDVRAAASLKTSIENAGQSYEEFGDRIDETAAKQVKFGHTDDEVNTALTKLVDSYGDAGAALDRMQLVADLAASKHISLAAAADMVASVHGGATKVLRAYNIQVEENADGTKDLEGALDQLTAKVDGQASNSVKGFTGWLKAMGAEIQNRVSEFAQQWAPAITIASGSLTAFGVVGEGVGKGLEVLRARQQAAAQAAAAFKVEQDLVANSSASVASLFEKEASSASRLGGAMKVGLAAGIAVAAFALADFLAGLDDVQVNIAEFGTKTEDELDKVAESFTGIASATGPGQSALREFEDQLIAGSVPAAERFADALDRAGINTDDFRDKIAAKREQDAQAQKDQEAYSDSVDEAAEKTKGYTVSTEDAAKAVKTLNDMHLGFIDTVTEGFAAAINLSNAEISTRSAIDDMNESLKDTTQSADDHKRSINDAAEAAQRQAEAAGEMAAKQAEANGMIDTASVKNLTMIGTLMDVQKTVKPGSDLWNSLEMYIQQLHNIPTSVNTLITTTSSGTPIQRAPDYRAHSARGQRNFRGGFSVVGEEGPELVYLPQGSDVYTASDTRAMLSGASGGSSSPVTGGGSQPLIVYVMLDGKVVGQSVTEHQARDERRNGRLPLRSVQ